jgi:hypothetical protein
MITTRDSSVGRAVDCRVTLTSIGHWFDSGLRDFCFFGSLSLQSPTNPNMLSALTDPLKRLSTVHQ